jgi:hypothetical protein
MLLLMAALFGMGMYRIVASTRRAMILAGIVSLVLILFTVLMFLGYDALRIHQQTTSNLLLESKRLCIRYVSHEIRSPLHTAHLGLKLLVQEMEVLAAPSAPQSLAGTPSGREGGMEERVKEKIDDWLALIAEIEESTERGNAIRLYDINRLFI